MKNSPNTPYFLIPVNDRDEPIDIRTYLLNKKRTIYLNSAIDENSAFHVAASIQFLAEKSAEDIVLYINSPGGNVSDGMVIMDAMRGCDCDIATVGTGMCASMGAFLLAAGTWGKRHALPNAKIMIHQPLGLAQGQASEIELAYKNIAKTKMLLTEYLAAFTRHKQSTEKITADIDRDFWLTAQEALEYGLIDGIGYNSR